jgi:hypothetical protein
MNVIVPLVFLVGVAVIVILAVRSQRSTKARQRNTRREFIERYPFPALLRRKLERAYPALNNAQIDIILEGLRQWFLLIARHPGRRFGMPSVAVDTAWHEFILMTRDYEAFCKQAFAEYLHHTPNHGGSSADKERDALSQTYALGPVAALGIGGAIAGSAAAGIGLFDIDRELAIEGGHLYTSTELGELTRRHAASMPAGGGGDGGGTFSVSDDPGGHGLEGGSASDGGSGGGDGGGCGGGCGS